MAALLERVRTGRGSYLNVAMFETMAEFVMADHLGARSFNPDEGDTGYNRLLTPYRKPYQTADGYLAVIVYNDKHWKTFFEVIGQMALYHADERFRTADKRADSYDYIYAFVARTIAQRSTAEWLALLGPAEIPCAPVNSVESLLHDEHLQSTGFFQSHRRASGTEWAASALPAVRNACAPYLGEHTDAYLSHPHLLQKA